LITDHHLDHMLLSGVGRIPRNEKIFFLLRVRSAQPIRFCANKEMTWTWFGLSVEGNLTRAQAGPVARD
jgi:hypothetical protein